MTYDGRLIIINNYYNLFSTFFIKLCTLTFNMSKKLFDIFNKINNKTSETPIEDSVVHKNEKPSDDCSISFNVNLSVTDNETKRNT